MQRLGKSSFGPWSESGVTTDETIDLKLGESAEAEKEADSPHSLGSSGAGTESVSFNLVGCHSKTI